MFDKRLFNVIILGLGFMFLFTALQTFDNIEKTVLDSVVIDDPTFKGDGYTSLSLIYIVFAFGNWFAPSIIAVLGPRLSMVIGSTAYALFIASFLIPKTWMLYGASALLGFGASVAWTGQGNYITLNSDEKTMARNSGIFWTLLQSSLLYGNLYVYMAFEGKTHIDRSTRDAVATVLAAMGGIGVIFLMVLRPAFSADGSQVTKKPVGPIRAFLNAMKLLTHKEMLLLCVTSLYTGFELTLYSGVYGPSIGSTLNIPNDSKRLIGLSGIVVGVGEVIGGSIFGLLGSKTVVWGRSPIILLGYFVHLVAFSGIFINIPNTAPLNDTHENAIIESNAILAIVCSGLLGFGDSCFNTQIYSAIGTIFPDESAPAFAIFKFMQSFGAAVAFFYSKYLGLYIQLSLLAFWATFGTIAYCISERIVNKNKNKDIECQTKE